MRSRFSLILMLAIVFFASLSPVQAAPVQQKQLYVKVAFAGTTWSSEDAVYVTDMSQNVCDWFSYFGAGSLQCSRTVVEAQIDSKASYTTADGQVNWSKLEAASLAAMPAGIDISDYSVVAFVFNGEIADGRMATNRTTATPTIFALRAGWYEGEAILLREEALAMGMVETGGPWSRDDFNVISAPGGTGTIKRWGPVPQGPGALNGHLMGFGPEIKVEVSDGGQQEIALLSVSLGISSPTEPIRVEIYRNGALAYLLENRQKVNFDVNIVDQGLVLTKYNGVSSQVWGGPTGLAWKVGEKFEDGDFRITVLSLGNVAKLKFESLVTTPSPTYTPTVTTTPTLTPTVTPTITATPAPQPAARIYLPLVKSGR